MTLVHDEQALYGITQDPLNSLAAHKKDACCVTARVRSENGGPVDQSQGLLGPSEVFTQMTPHQNSDATPGTYWAIFMLFIGCHVNFDTCVSTF